MAEVLVIRNHHVGIRRGTISSRLTAFRLFFRLVCAFSNQQVKMGDPIRWAGRQVGYRYACTLAQRGVED